MAVAARGAPLGGRARGTSGRVRPRHARRAGRRCACGASTDAAPGAEAAATTETETAASPPAKGRVLVLGASGGVGKQTVELLQEAGFLVRAAVKDPAKRTATQCDDVVVLDVTQYETLPAAFDGVDAVVIACATTDFSNPFSPALVEYNGTKNVVAAARNTSAPRLVLVTSLGTEAPLLNPLNLAFGILSFKRLAEEEVQRSGLGYTIIRPGGLSNEAVPGKVQLKRRGEAATGRVWRRDVARACVAAIEAPDLADNKIVEMIAVEGAPDRELADMFGDI